MMLQTNAAMLMRRLMEKKQALIQEQLRKAGIAGQLSDRLSQADDSGKVQMTETRIYVGLNDADTREQLFDTETYLGILKEICRECHAAFSVDVEQGGYFHEDGEYVEETSLVLELIDAERETVEKIAQDLRTRFHQESVLVTEDRIGGCYIYSEEKG